MTSKGSQAHAHPPELLPLWPSSRSPKATAYSRASTGPAARMTKPNEQLFLVDRELPRPRRVQTACPLAFCFLAVVVLHLSSREGSHFQPKELGSPMGIPERYIGRWTLLSQMTVHHYSSIPAL